MNNHVKSTDVPTTFKMHEDRDRRWLEVPYAALTALHMDGVITEFSFISGDTAYLDEDCDAPFFIQTWLRYHRRHRTDYNLFWAVCQTVWDGHTSFIRGLDQYNPRW